MSNAAKIGLAVLFTPHFSAGIIAQQAATVSAVNEDGTVNLTVFAPDGYPYGVQRVPFLTDEDATPGDGMYATDATSTKDRETSPAEAGNAPSTSEATESNSTAEAGNGSTAQELQSGPTSSSEASGKPAHESVIKRIEDGAEHLKEDVEHVFHHDSAEGEQPPKA